MMHEFGKETGTVRRCIKNKATDFATLEVLVDPARFGGAVRIIQFLRYIIGIKINLEDIPYYPLQATSDSSSVE